jgi:hypothetical protein
MKKVEDFLFFVIIRFKDFNKMEPRITLIKRVFIKKISEIRESSGVVAGCLLPRVFREIGGLKLFC